MAYSSRCVADDDDDELLVRASAVLKSQGPETGPVVRQCKGMPAGELLVTNQDKDAGRARTGAGGGCVVVACRTLLVPKGEKLT